MTNIITLDDIKYFNIISEKKDNDKFNKKRENIIIKVINNCKEIEDFYEKSNDWKNFKKFINDYINIIIEKKNITEPIKKIKAQKKG